ncbi:hypothetical protein Tco_1376205 [Tanacetum coccineum]
MSQTSSYQSFDNRYLLILRFVSLKSNLRAYLTRNMYPPECFSRVSSIRLHDQRLRMLVVSSKPEPFVIPDVPC